MTARSLRFQLTALVDLLLIIVFAQFAELRQRQFDDEERQKAEILEIQQRYDRGLELSQKTSESAINESKQETDQYRQQLNQTLESMQTAFAELSSDPPETSIQGFNVGERFRELATSHPDDVVRFFVGYDELLKRAEVWLLHARDSGEIVVNFDNEVKRFRLESDNQQSRSNEFADKFFATYKQIRQPKGLVIILASYDLRSTAGVYQAVIDGLPRAADRLRADAPQTRFEFSVLGPTSDPIKTE